jgi:hypothetical protein
MPPPAPLSGSREFGPALLDDDPTSLPKPVLNFCLDYATPGYTEDGLRRQGPLPTVRDASAVAPA